jgi:hypothetical protein
MKDLRTLLLGSAASLVAVTAGHAADLPVKAKPIEYVKVCSLYGAGFYYMPGTDLCIKIGGWVRIAAGYGVNGNETGGQLNKNLNNRATSNEVFRVRGYITADVRNQTEYGTVRGYVAVGLLTNDVGLQVASLVDSANRAFVQWAGMTAGLSQSFFDFYSPAAVQYHGSALPASDTGDSGWWVWAYTAQFGGGFSGTISSEARRTTQIIDQIAAGATVGTATTGSVVPGNYINNIISSIAVAGGSSLFPGAGAYGGLQAPDVVANLRVDQTWGGAQIMGAAHEVNASYYTAAIPGSDNPGDVWGWAAGFGFKVNTPFIAQGDFLQTQFNVTRGALRYLFFGPNFNFGVQKGANESYGVLSDCVYGGTIAGANNTGCQLTSAWGFNAGYDHYWAPKWHTSLYGAFYEVKYNTSANAMLCGLEGNAAGAAFGVAAVAGAGCNNNWSTWGIGSRTQWDISERFYLGAEVLYQNLHSATLNGAGTIAGPLVYGAATANAMNENNLMIAVRAHRDFLP